MGHMVCDPCSCFLLLCILIAQLYQIFGAQNMYIDRKAQAKAQINSMAKARACSTKCIKRIEALNLSKGKVKAGGDCLQECIEGTTKPEDFYPYHTGKIA